MGRSKPDCLSCGKKGHRTADCRLRKAVNKPKDKPQQNGRQEQHKANNTSCNHCGKAGHTKAECFILNPSLKHQRKGQQPQQGDAKKKCTHCQKGGHTVDECFKANPELRSEQGKNKPQEEPRCSYCMMPDHTIERCYVLNPELGNPFHSSTKAQDPWEELANARRHKDDEPPPLRLLRRIKDAEALAFDQTPPEIQRHYKVQRIQGWYPARQTYVTLPIYGAIVDRPVKYNKNVFNQPLHFPAYEAFDTSGDAIMCSCGFPEGYECNLEHWVREAVQQEERFKFSDRSENAYTRIMGEGLVDPGATFVIC